MEKIVEKIVRYLIEKFLKRYHLALNPPKGRRKAANVVSEGSSIIESTAGVNMDQWTEASHVNSGVVREAEKDKVKAIHSKKGA